MADTILPTIKSCPSQVTFEEIQQAADMWDAGVKAKTIAFDLNWTEGVFTRVVRVSREVGEGYFPRRRKCVPQWDDDEALRAAKKPVPLTAHQRQMLLSAKGLKPCTVKARRPADYMPRRKFVDPTLSLPERRA